MPELNGFKLQQLFIRKDKLKNIPIIFITAFSYDELYFQRLQDRGVDYIYKPIKPEL
jgi:CheY-like chemotaxis protein